MDTSSNPLESPELTDSSPYSQDYNRYLHVGMGGSLPGSNNWWPLVPDGNQLSYQLSRTTGCLSSSSVLYQKSSLSIDHLFKHGQYISHSLSQSQGRNIISPTVQPCQTSMGVVHVSEHHTSGQSLTRPPEHNSRQKILNSAGQMGLAITPQYFPEDQSEMGTTISGSVYIQVDTSTTRVFQLETRSLCDSLSSDMVWEDMLCQSPVGPHAHNLSEISQQQADVIILAPVWKAQAWYPILLSLLFDYLHLAPPLPHPLVVPD